MLLSNVPTAAAGRASRCNHSKHSIGLVHTSHRHARAQPAHGRALGDKHVVRVLEEPVTKKSSAEAFIEELEQSVGHSDHDEPDQSIIAADISDLEQQVTNIEQQVRCSLLIGNKAGPTCRTFYYMYDKYRTRLHFGLVMSTRNSNSRLSPDTLLTTAYVMAQPVS